LRRLFMLRIKSHLALIPLLLLSKPNPLRWASVWVFGAASKVSSDYKKEGHAYCVPFFLGSARGARSTPGVFDMLGRNGSVLRQGFAAQNACDARQTRGRRRRRRLLFQSKRRLSFTPSLLLFKCDSLRWAPIRG